MAYAGKLTVKVQNANVDASNYQLVNFDFNADVADLDGCAAACIAYLASCGASDAIAGSSSIVGIESRAAGSAGAVSVPFPAAAYTALLGTGTPPPTFALAYPAGIGGGAMCPLGTSISVSEKTATVGRTGRGRHFLPYTSNDAINGGGTLLAAVQGLIETYYDQFMFGTAIGISPDPVVRAGGVYSGGHPITVVKAQPVLSNLESRRR